MTEAYSKETGEHDPVETERVSQAEIEKLRKGSAICAGCPLPGYCCREVRFFGSATGEYTYWLDGDDAAYVEGQVAEHLKNAGETAENPFRLLRIESRDQSDTDSQGQGREYGRAVFSCVNLLPSGRCGDYENRPRLCRIFVPGRDQPCVMTGPNENGDHYGNEVIELETKAAIHA